jgi:hypothetical protein
MVLDQPLAFTGGLFADDAAVLAVSFTTSHLPGEAHSVFKTVR